MANRPITELDFATIKAQLKTFLSAQSKFQDYDFEGSNMAVLLDVMAYNAYQSNFYTNMIFTESFLDSAVKEESIMSHAKSLNYLPRSAKSAMAVVDISIVSANNEASFTIPSGTKFTTTANGDTYTFFTNTGHIAPRVAGTNRYAANCVQIFEGTLVEERFTMAADFDGFYISNADVDTSSIKVVDLTSNTEYAFKTDVFGVDTTDHVFYLEPEKKSYKVIFGKNVFGADPELGSQIAVTYRTTNGEEANGANRFSTTVFSNTTVTVLAAAIGGSEKESLDSIRFFAPKSVQVQERAVTRKDYEILLKQRFVEILDVSVYDGADLTPPQHGKVAVSVNVAGGISNANRSAFIAYLSDKTPLAIQPVFIDADYLYIRPTITVRVNNNIRTKSIGEIKQLIIDAVMSYNLAYLEKFASVFRDSRLAAELNNVDPSVLSVAISVNPYMEYSPQLNIAYSPSFQFNAALVKPYPFSSSQGLTSYTPAVKGQTFVYEGIRSFFQDDGLGNLQIISADISNVTILEPEAGTIDYTTGAVRLSDFAVESFEGAAITIAANYVAEDILAPKNRVLRIRDSDITVNVIGT